MLRMTLVALSLSFLMPYEWWRALQDLSPYHRANWEIELNREVALQIAA